MSVLSRIQENRNLALDLISQGALAAAAIYLGENIIFWKYGDPALLRDMEGESQTDAALAKRIYNGTPKEPLVVKYRSVIEYLDRLMHFGCDGYEERVQAVTLAANALQLSEFLPTIGVEMESPEAIAQRLVEIFGGRKELVVSTEKAVTRKNPIYISVFSIAASGRAHISKPENGRDLE